MNRYTYHFFEMAQLAMAPARALSDFTRMALKNPANPMSHTAAGRNLAASAELFERMTRRYGKPAFGLDKTLVAGREIAVEEEIVWMRPFCQILHFKRDLPRRRRPAPPADRRSHVRPLRHAVARHGGDLPADPSTSTSLTGSTPAGCRWRSASSISTITSIMSRNGDARAAADPASTSSPCASLPCRCWPPWR